MVLRLSDSWSNLNLEMWVSFWGEGKQGYRRKTSRSKEEDQQQTQPTHGVDAGIKTRATLVGGKCSHRCATLAPQEPKLPTVARLAQLDKRRSTEREAAGSSPDRINTQGL